MLSLTQMYAVTSIRHSDLVHGHQPPCSPPGQQPLLSGNTFNCSITLHRGVKLTATFSGFAEAFERKRKALLWLHVLSNVGSKLFSWPNADPEPVGVSHQQARTERPQEELL